MLEFLGPNSTLIGLLSVSTIPSMGPLLRSARSMSSTSWSLRYLSDEGYGREGEDGDSSMADVADHPHALEEIMVGLPDEEVVSLGHRHPEV